MLKQLLVSSASAAQDGSRPHGCTEEYNLNVIIYTKTYYLILIDHSNLWGCGIKPGVWTFRWKILRILSDTKSAIILVAHAEGILFLIESQVSLIG